ncbi:MAG: hypothetical protein ACJ77A_17820 [Actinomycetota bacterium]
MAGDVRKYTADARRYVEAALGNLTPTGARDLARSMVEQAQGFAAGQSPGAMAGQVAGQVREVAQQLMEWSQQSRERVVELVQGEVRKQLKAFGIASRDDVDALRKRVRDLEKGGAAPAAKRTTTRKSSARRPAAKRSGSAAKRSGSSAKSSKSTRKSPAKSAAKRSTTGS